MRGNKRVVYPAPYLKGKQIRHIESGKVFNDTLEAALYLYHKNRKNLLLSCESVLKDYLLGFFDESRFVEEFGKENLFEVFESKKKILGR